MGDITLRHLAGGFYQVLLGIETRRRSLDDWREWGDRSRFLSAGPGKDAETLRKLGETLRKVGETLRKRAETRRVRTEAFREAAEALETRRLCLRVEI
jgi:hypothetical protein